MPDSVRPADASPVAAAPVGASAGPATEAPPEWKPEPRQWSWKDLFTAPMLAFKPKCMLVSGLTAVLLGLWLALLIAPLGGRGALLENLIRNNDSRFWLYLVIWFWIAVGSVVFSLGATFVAVFMKADLLDDEFLTYREAWALFKDRALPAILVPLFMLVLVTGIWVAIWLGGVFSSIPYVGPVLYALLGYPLAILACIFGLLVTWAVILSLFLFPGIIAIRRHGWFDNVVDTIEAVGTKPHQLIASLVLSGLLALVVYQIGHGALERMTGVTRQLPLMGEQNQVSQATEVANTYRTNWLQYIDPESHERSLSRDYIFGDRDMVYNSNVFSGFVKVIGTVVAAWQTIIIVILLGYCLNLMIAGGLLTYLWVREDDYWDDEDLQDLDQLAKELEDEAKRAEVAPVAAT